MAILKIFDLLSLIVIKQSVAFFVLILYSQRVPDPKILARGIRSFLGTALLLLALWPSRNISGQGTGSTGVDVPLPTFHLLYEDSYQHPDEPSIRGGIFIWAFLPEGRLVTILDPESGRTFVTKTAENLSHYDWNVQEDVYLTALSSIPTWDINFGKTFYGRAKSYIAFQGKVNGKVIPIYPGSVSEGVAELDGVIRSGEFLESMDGAVWHGENYPKDQKPTLENLEFPEQTYTIATYPIVIRSNTFVGPKFLITPDRKAYPLSGICSLPVRAFVLNGNKYLLCGSNSCEPYSVNYLQIFMIKPTGLVEVFSSMVY